MSDCWRESYEMVRDAILQHLEPFVHDDDVAEEAILIDTIERVGACLRQVRVDEETGGYVGAVDLVALTGWAPACPRCGAAAGEPCTAEPRGGDIREVNYHREREVTWHREREVRP